MPIKIPIFLVFFLLSSYLANSVIFTKENRLLYIYSSGSTYYSSGQENLPKLSEQVPKTSQISQKEPIELQSSQNQISSFKKSSGYLALDSLKSAAKILNLNRIKHSHKQTPSNYEDESDIIYTNDLHLCSALGIEKGTKTMDYIKSKVETNRKSIFEHNFSKRRAYRLAENKFIIYTPQEFREIYLNLKEPENRISNKSQQITVVTSPNIRILQDTTLNINWKTAKKMTSVKFQQSCGACYSFTAIGTMQSAYLVKNNSNLNLAEQQLIDCSTPYDNVGCVGGWTINSYRYIKDFGVVFESDYPYIADIGNCSVPANRPKYFIKSYVELANDCNIVIEALKKQPLSIAINAEGWMYYSSGVYTDCREGASNHGVILAGADANNWLIKNSWGFTWGESGYIRISRNAPHEACNVCKWGSYPII